MSKQSTVSETVKINGQEITFTIGKYAHLANAAVLVQSGETIVHVTVTTSRRDTEKSYFPLFVEYQEKLYAGGIIKGSRWVKREGRPSEDAILTARLIDRSIRPLFPKEYRKEVQVVATVLSVDNQHSPDILAILGAAAALSASDVPWNGPVAAVRMGLVDNQLVANPLEEQQEESQLDLVLSGNQDSIVMVEAGANEVSEETVLKALSEAKEVLGKLSEGIKNLAKKVSPTKQPVPESETIQKELGSEIEKKLKDFISKLLPKIEVDEGSRDEIYDLVDRLDEEYEEVKKSLIQDLADKLFKDAVRQKLFDKKTRIDGRKTDEIRDLTAETGLFPRTHGSAMFKRGETQAVTIVTLGSPSEEQWIESMEGEETKRYIHHYYMPPFSVGETGRMGWPSRREIGHGALAERALLPMIPDEDKFPYTIRVVSEIMTSNGSTSQASVCGSSLSLMDAGVPIKKPVAGIAMGLISKKDTAQSLDDCEILTDIQGLEDHLGDMDFKVAGTKDGINAIQMDIKIKGVSTKVLTQALKQAKVARLKILEVMNQEISQARKNLSQYAPKISVVYVEEDKIGEVIGPGGRVIREITKETGATVDINDEGRVTVTGPDKKSVSKALEWIEGITKEVKPNEEYDGTVTRVEPYGIFVEILPGKEGLVHVSRMSTDYVADATKLYSVGDEVHARVTEIDDMGRIALSLLTKEQEKNRGKKSKSKKRSSHRPRR